MSEEYEFSQDEQDNNYILKGFSSRKKVAKEVIFGDEVSKSQKGQDIPSKGDPHVSQNQSLQNCSSREEESHNESDHIEKKEDKEEQKREAEKRLIEEEIQRKKIPRSEPQQQQGEDQYSNGLEDLIFNQKCNPENSVPAESERQGSNINSQKQVQQPEQVPESIEEIREPEKQIQVLKHKLQRLSVFNEGHIHPIIKAVSENNKIIELTQKRFEDQNTILSQFKEETSKKLEENIKSTLKEKMNEMNRDNAKELKDIKNMSLFIQELLEKYNSKMDRIERNIDDMLKNNQKK